MSEEHGGIFDSKMAGWHLRHGKSALLLLRHSETKMNSHTLIPNISHVTFYPNSYNTKIFSLRNSNTNIFSLRYSNTKVFSLRNSNTKIFL